MQGSNTTKNSPPPRPPPFALCAAAFLLVSPASAQNNAPTITSPSTFNVSEGSTAVATLTATDPESDPLIWSIADPAGADGALFTLISATGALAFTEAPDYENSGDSDTDRVYEVTVEVSDSTASTTADLAVTVTDVAPGLSGPTTANHPEGKRGLRIATYTVNDVNLWSLAGDDAAEFTITDGFLRFVDPPDHESASDSNTDNVYNVTVQAGDGTATETVDVEVAVDDADEPGVVTLSPLRPKRGVPLTATLEDPDNSGTPTWQWERNNGREGWETIDGATAASYTPTAADGDRYLRATATYTDDFGSGKTAKAMAPHVVIAYRLSALTFTGLTGVDGDSRAFYPAFDPDTLHYAARCTAPSMTLTLSTEDTDTRLSVNGVQQPKDTALTHAFHSLAGLTASTDIRIALSGSDGATTTYTVHCLHRRFFPKLTTVKNTGATEDLAMFKAKLRPSGQWWRGYLIMMDNNGVPRFRRYVGDNIFEYFRVHPDETHPRARYSFQKQGSSYRRDGTEMVVFDKYFNVEASDIHILSPFRNTDAHDQLVLPNGNYALMAYHPRTRPLAFLNSKFPTLRNSNGNRLSNTESIQESSIQIRTPGGGATFNWTSWQNMAIEDCIRSSTFQPEWGHINSLSWFDGDIIAGFRGCSKILRIDVDTGNVVWRAGPSLYSRAEWEAGETLQSNLGPAPLDFVNDPNGGFSGQHGGHMTLSGNLLVYDNNSHCQSPPGFPEGAKGHAECLTRTRAVEYAIDTANGELVFQREFLLSGSNQAGPAGHAEPMPNGDWFVSWSGARVLQNSAVHVDAETDMQKLVVKVQHLTGNGAIVPIRVVRNSPVALAAPVEPLEAEVLQSPDFHTGATDGPKIIVAFNQPVVDAEVSESSTTVTGATVAAARHVEAGAPAHSYAFTLTPTGDGEIRFALSTADECSSNVICTAARDALETAPAEIVIPGPVAVTLGSATYSVFEGENVAVTVHLNRGHGRSGPLTIPIELQGGSAAPGDDFNAPSSLSFGSTDTAGTVAVAALADKLVEGDETVTLGFPSALPRGVSAGSVAATMVTVVDATDDTIRLTPTTSEVSEGNSVDLTFGAGAGITFIRDQTIALAVSGSAQEADYTVSTGGQILTAPYALTLPAGDNHVVATVRIVDDVTQEGQETIAIAATRGADTAGSATVTIPASDGPLPKIIVAARSSGSATEGEMLSFSLERTGAATHELSVTVKVTESGAMLGPNQPTTATFAAGSQTATVTVSTATDSVVEDASEIKFTIVSAGSTAYEVGAPQSTTVTVADDDRATLDLTLMPSTVAEGSTAHLRIAITNAVTFAEDRDIYLAVGGTASPADYTLSAAGGALAAPYVLTLAAGASFVEAVLTAVNDEETEEAETLTISASTDSEPAGAGTIMIEASDSPPQVSVVAVQSEMTEGASVEFTFTRTNPTQPGELPEITVPLTFLDTGNRLDGTPPPSVTFGAGATQETLALPTRPDEVVQAGPGEVTVTLTPSARTPTAYNISGTGTARVAVADDDRPEFSISVSSTVVAEGQQVTIRANILNGVVFEGRSPVTLFSADGRGSASFGTDYTIASGRNNEADTPFVRPNRDSAGGTIHIEDDSLREGAETIRIAAAWAGKAIGAPVTITIAANDGHPDTQLPPELDTAKINGAELTLLYTKPLDGSSQPANGDFAVRVDGNSRDVSTVQIEGAEVWLTLTSAASHGERVQVDYTPGANPLRDIDGNTAPAASGRTAVETLVFAVGDGAPEGDPIIFRVVLSHAVATSLDLDWSLSDGTARSGVD